MNLQNYKDDLIYIGLPSSVDQVYHSLLDLLQKLGLAKGASPETKVVCMVIVIDTIQRTMAIPVDKLDQTMKVCEDGRINEFVQKTITISFRFAAFC